MEIESIRELVVSAAREVGKRIGEQVAARDSGEISFKGINDIVTEVDIWSEKIVSQRVLERFPDALIIGEETAVALKEQRKMSLEQLAQKGLCFIVDPIDGTSNFANSLPHVCVSIGALVNGVRQVGVVYDPCRDELFEATKGKGAKLNGQAISVGSKEVVINSLLATGFPYDRESRMELYTPLFEKLCTSARSLRVTGSSALDQCWVACGRLDGFVEYNLKPWDAAAGSLIVEEAGGKAGNFAAIDGDSYSVFAASYLYANPKLYDQLFTLAREADITGRRNLAAKSL